MDILLDENGDIYVNDKGDITIAESIAQKIRVKVLWNEGEWRWNEEEGLPYLSDLFVKNPNLNHMEAAIRERIFEIDEITAVDDVTISLDKKTRTATISLVARTDQETINEEVNIECLITE